MVFTKVLISVLVASTFIGCDKPQAPKVPSGAGARFAPPDVGGVSPPPVDAAPGPEVAAWVNGEPLYETEVQRHVDRVRRRFRRRTHNAGQPRRAQIVERLIDERLITQKIAEAHVEIPDSRVEQVLRRRTDELFGSVDALNRHLQERQITMDEYREELRRDLQTRQLLHSSDGDDSDNDKDDASQTAVQELYTTVTNRPATVVRYRLTSLFFGRDVDRSQVVERLTGVDSAQAFSALASEAARTVDVGWVERSSMSDSLADKVRPVEPPGITEPIDTPTGFEVYWVHEAEAQPTEHFRQLEPTLRPRVDAMRRDRALEELLRELRAGASVKRAASD